MGKATARMRLYILNCFFRNDNGDEHTVEKIIPDKVSFFDELLGRRPKERFYHSAVGTHDTPWIMVRT